ncbi:hypothetical protein FRC03_007025 [Tulasnella sp. 419]|nr:hypothetical protein FRC03_007025 [Tulasnella sp. 419]
MDVLSTAIDLGITITAAVEQISPNGSESATISGDIVNSLLQIEKHLKQQTLGAPEVLRDDLNHFERELRRILRHQERLIKRASNGQIPEARGKLKQVYNADDINDRLVDLHQKVQKCYQNLQMSRITRKDGKLTTGNLQKDAMQDEHVR